MTTIHKGDTVLVTGATGYIGAHVVEELIAIGYKVRGVSRSIDKAQFLARLMEKKFGKGKLEIVEVPDMIADDAYDKAVKGVSGIIHLASVVNFNTTDPDVVIPPTIKGVLNILKAARTEPMVRSLVVTSSSTAALSPQPNKKIIVHKDTWNEAVLEKIRTSSQPHTFEIYSASKTEAEKALWAAFKEHKPRFQVATVLPNANFGTRFTEAGNSTADWLMGVYTGKNKALSEFPPQYYVNVSDDAKLHVVALVDPACNGDRIFAFAAPYAYNDILAVLRKLEPGKDFGEDVEQGHDLSVVPNKEAEELLKKHYGHGFVGLEDTIKQCIAPVVT